MTRLTTKNMTLKENELRDILWPNSILHSILKVYFCEKIKNVIILYIKILQQFTILNNIFVYYFL